MTIIVAIEFLYQKKGNVWVISFMNWDPDTWDDLTEWTNLRLFWTLYHWILQYYPKIEKDVNQKRKRKNHDNHPPPGGVILTAVHLSIAMQYFTGGSPQNLIYVHGVGYNDIYIYISVWNIVDAVNLWPQLYSSASLLTVESRK